MTTLTQTPTYALPGQQIQTVVTATGSGANYVRIWCTDAPNGSTRKALLDADASSRVFEWEGKSGETWSLTPDKAGVFVFAVQEYTKGGIGTVKSYDHDTGNAPTETKVGTESTPSVYVGHRLEQRIGTGADTATLVLHVWNDTIRATTLKQHGIKSPAVIDTSGDRAHTASLDADVSTALDALADVVATTAIGDPSALLTAQLSVIAAHYSQAGVHAANDSDNVPGNAYKVPAASAVGSIESAAELAKSLNRHMRNDSGSGTGSAGYHAATTDDDVDWPNLPALTTAAQLHDMATAIAANYDSYEAHRINTVVHGSADSTNVMAAPPKLYDVHRAFLSALRATSPTNPATMNSGATALVHRGGFRIAN